MNFLISFLKVFVLVVCPLAVLLLVARLVVAPFSPKVSGQMRKHPVAHLVWGCFAFVGVLFMAGFINMDMWPPVSVERREQRAKVMERVQAAGGWDAIRRDCVAFAAQNTNGFYLHWRDTNLPPAVLALKPMLVEYEPQYGSISMRIFGMHSTGGHSSPYFGLEVDVSSNAVSYKRGTGNVHGGVVGNRHSVAKQVAEGIYEIY